MAKMKRRAPCIRANCQACQSGTQHGELGSLRASEGGRFSIYIPEDLVPEVQRCLDKGHAKGNPSDADHVPPSRKRHMKALAHVPKLYGADRGFFSEQNLASCARSGVSTVCILRRGGKKTPVREAFEKGQRFRAGIEGRISVPARGRGMKRCLAEGSDQLELWVRCGGTCQRSHDHCVADEAINSPATRRRINPNAASARSGWLALPKRVFTFLA
jgi:hypothetical protein